MERCGSPTGKTSTQYDRHLVFDHVVSEQDASQRERFEAVARSLRDLLTQRWLLTQQTHDRENPKRVYYLSMEFLIGRTLANNIINLGVEQFVREDLQSDPLQDWKQMVETEPDAGLGNGGLGRLAACFIDSLATLQIPAMGYGLRYEYGIFRQTIENGFQVEQPDHWLAQPDPWEVTRPRESVNIPFGCSFELHDGRLRAVPGHPTRTYRHAVRPSRRRLRRPDDQYAAAVGSGVARLLRLSVNSARAISSARWPTDSSPRPSPACFIRMIPRKPARHCDLCRSIFWSAARWPTSWPVFAERTATGGSCRQGGDPAERHAPGDGRRRVDADSCSIKHKLGWDEAWDLTVRTLAYTNHTLLPEALEKWPVRYFELVCPRLLEIIYEINRRFLDDVSQRFPDDAGRIQRMSLIDEASDAHVRMANLAIVGTHSTNGVAKIHSELLRTTTVKDFAEMFPERFNNKTNGVTPRRWLLQANPALARVITDAIGDNWMHRPRSVEPTHAAGRRQQLPQCISQGEARCKGDLRKLAQVYLAKSVDPDTIFDCQVKRIHEYKRQLAQRAAHRRALQSAARESEVTTSSREHFSSRARQPRPITWRN